VLFETPFESGVQSTLDLDGPRRVAGEQVDRTQVERCIDPGLVVADLVGDLDRLRCPRSCLVGVLLGGRQMRQVAVRHRELLAGGASSLEHRHCFAADLPGLRDVTLIAQQ
jgi:hypothetical protein